MPTAERGSQNGQQTGVETAGEKLLKRQRAPLEARFVYSKLVATGYARFA
jgi:hypothetical protein